MYLWQARQPLFMTQDLPPRGGFPSQFNYKRNLPARGPSGAILLAGVTGIILFGVVMNRKSTFIIQ
jgi:hypothetical protein